MQSRNRNYTFDTTYAFGTDNLLNPPIRILESFPIPSGNFELLDGTPFLLLDGTNFLLL